jgi:adenylate cyclase
LPLKSEKTTPDLILLDLMMPEMDGFECCRVLKSNERLRDIPVIFLTSKTETSEMIKGFETGAVDYIFKPFNTEELLARINVQLTLRRAHLEQEKLTQKASRYISPNVFRAIYKGEKDAILDTIQKPLTIFFSDIVNFTRITETMGDKELTKWLNNYFDRMSATVMKHGGTLDKFIGDAVMVFFGDPDSKGEKSDAEACVRMALDMIEEANSLGIEIRVGINSAPAFVGNFGTK